MFKGFFKFVFGLVRLAFLMIILAAIFHTWVIRQVLTFSLSYQLGADVLIRSVKMDWKNTGFEVQGLEIGNPYSFPKGPLANIPLVIISVDLHAIPDGVLRFKTVGVDLRELQVINVSQKGLNLLALKSLQKGSGERPLSASRKAVETATTKNESQAVIDELIFSIGDINYLDTSGPSLKQTHYRVGIRGATYYNIRGTQDIVAIVVGEALKKMGFGYLETQFQKFQDRAISSEDKKDGFFNRLWKAF